MNATSSTLRPPPPHVTKRRDRRPDQPRIAVVGASLTGATAALLLLDAGFEHVAVYDAAPDGPRAGGGLISLEHPALDVLDRLGIEQREFVTGPFESIVQISVDGCVPRTVVHRPYPGRFTTWTLLHAALTARLPRAVVQHGRKVVDLDVVYGRP